MASEVTKRHISPAKAVLGSLAGLIIAAAAVLVGVNIFIRMSYDAFYDKAIREFSIPGISSGFVVQDIAYVTSIDNNSIEEGAPSADQNANGAWIFSGYMSGQPSPIWRINPDGTTSHIFVALPDGAKYEGHGSGITSWGDYVYLTCDNGYLVIKKADVLAARDRSGVRAQEFVDLGFTPSFINVQDDVMYTGVFYHPDQYETPESMHIVTPDGTKNHAIMYAYEQNPATKWGFGSIPHAAYSIPDKVQGVCKTPDGNFIFSTSWGIDASVLPCYSSALTQDGTFEAKGRQVPLFCFDSRTYIMDVTAPPMSEGIILHEGRVFISNEAASNKYIFGKLYGAGNVYSIEI